MNKLENEIGLVTYDLKKSFSDIIALDGVNMKILNGRIVALLGQNGAGKTTLIRLLSAVMAPSSGTALIRGYDLIKQTNDVKRITGLLPEEYALYEKLSVYEYLQFIATLYDVSKKNFEIRFAKYTEKLNLNLMNNRLIETLSKGQKQKVALIASLIHEPLILLLDEPLANLDIKAQRVVREIILDYRSQSRIILIATHLLYNIQSICDDIIIINEGEIIFSGSIKEFQGNFANLEDSYLEKIELGTLGTE